MKDSEVLRRALELMGPEGENWQQLGLGVKYHFEKHCMMIAINRAQPEEGGVLFGSALPFAHKLGFSSYTEATTWNDAPGRTFAEVRELFEKQIAFAEVLERDQAAKAGIRSC